MNSNLLGITVFVLLMLLGAWALQDTAAPRGTTVEAPSSTNQQREVIFSDGISALYERDAENLYCSNDGSVLSTDPDNFIVIGALLHDDGQTFKWYYAIDNSAVYFKCDLIEGADPTAFTLFQYDFGNGPEAMETYGFDGKNIFYEDRAIMEATLEVFENDPMLAEAILASYEAIYENE